MATSNILLFAPNDTGTNLETQAAYLAASDRLAGNQPGVARSKLVNKALRQTSAMAAGLAQFIAARQGADVDDGLTPTALASMLGAAMTGRLLRVLVIGATTQYVPTPGCRVALAEVMGGGGGGGGSGNTGANAVSAGSGGASGSYLRHVFYDPTQMTCVIGAGGSAGQPGQPGGAGGTTSLGSLVAYGGNGGPCGNFTPPWLLIGGQPGAPATGSNFFNSIGAQGGQSFALALGAFLSGVGASSPFGGGGQSIGTCTSGGFSAQSYGAGGGGAITGSSSPGQVGGAGGQGVVIIHEFGGN